MLGGLKFLTMGVSETCKNRRDSPVASGALEQPSDHLPVTSAVY
jgi:hypothetical protein